MKQWKIAVIGPFLGGADVVEGIGIVMLCHPEDVTDCGSQRMYGESFVAYTGEVPSRQGEIC